MFLTQVCIYLSRKILYHVSQNPGGTEFFRRIKFRTYFVAIFCIFTFLYLGLTSGYLQAEITDVQQSNTVRVSTTGVNSADCGSEAQPCQTIQFAIQNRAAMSGDTVLVAAGTYIYDANSDICQENLGTTGVICIVNKEVILQGGYASGNWSDQNFTTNETILDGNNTLRGAMVVSTGPTTSLVMDGFTIQNGLAQGIAVRPYPDNISAFGGGMFIDSAQSVALKNVIFRTNRSIGNDTGDPAGGNGAGGGLATRRTSVTLENVTFDSNQAIGGAGSQRGGYGTGGGIQTAGSTITGSNVQFLNNVSTGGNTAGNGVDNNGIRADALGAGASYQDDSNIILENIIARDNRATGGNGSVNSGGAFGAGIFVEKANATFTNIELRNNIAKGGQAPSAWLGRGGGAEFIDAVVRLTNVIAIDNQAIGGDGSTGDRGSAGGGGLSATSFNTAYPSSIELTNGVIAGNFVNMGEGTNITGGGGGGLLIQGLQANISHITVVNNRTGSSYMFAPGIIVMNVLGQRGANATLSHSIIADHAGTPATIHVQDLSTLTLNNNLWSNNSGRVDGSGNTSGNETMLEGDAGFVDPINHDYHIINSSAAVDQASSSNVMVDIEGRAREGQADIGAFEFVSIVDTPTLTITPTPMPTVTPIPLDTGLKTYLPIIIN